MTKLERPQQLNLYVAANLSVILVIIRQTKPTFELEPVFDAKLERNAIKMTKAKAVLLLWIIYVFLSCFVMPSCTSVC